MSTALANPAEMIAHGAPRVIHNDAELEVYTEALFQLTALEKPSASETEAIELLTLLVERYEEARYPVPSADLGNGSAVPYRTAAPCPARSDSTIRIGECGFYVSCGTTELLTPRQVRNLSARFKVPADIFIGGR